MKPVSCCFTLLLAFAFLQSAPVADAAPQAVSGVVSGDVQMVGFRAMILKQAIAFNLAGTAKNNADGSVQFVLQGDTKRIKDALKEIEKGTDKSKNVKVTTTAGTVDPQLNTFTVIDWTSTSRKITKPYNLVFTVRPDDSKVSEKDAKEVYHEILKKTLDADDLKKLSEKEDD